MNREILFRGKTLTNEWVYGAYYKQEEYYGDEEDAHCIITSKDVLSNDLGLDYAVVIPETIGQYTGLTAKGKKIFEGDIVRIIERGHVLIGKIIFKNCYPGGWLVADETEKSTCSLAMRDDVEVIGTIHDNPELLGKEDEKNG